MSVKALHAANALLVLVIGAWSPRTVAATFVINNTNGSGVGFNDERTPDAAAGCNAGEALGQCRLRVFNHAASQWGSVMESGVPITMNGGMVAQTCNDPVNGTTLGSTSVNSWHADFANAPRPGTAYVQALANSLAGTDLSATNDMTITFNAGLDDSCLPGTSGWWYGTDPAVAVPADRTPLMPVVFHEIGHGLGFTAGYAPSGAAVTSGVSGSVPIMGYYLFDAATRKVWKDMTNAERQASTLNDPNLVWTGPRTNQWAPKFLGPAAAIVIQSPAAIAGSNAAQAAGFGANVVTHPVTAEIVLVNDGVAGAGTINDGCDLPFANAAALDGRIALIDRGLCNFTIKAKNAELSGAVGVIIANNTAAGLAGMGGVDATITIAALGSTQALGAAIKSSLLSGSVTATLGISSSGDLSGQTSGCVRMFGPNPYVAGSSVSHFTSDALPNLLMEPGLNRSIFNTIDLTLPLFRDIGWETSFQDILFLDGFDSNRCQFVQP